MGDSRVVEHGIRGIEFLRLLSRLSADNLS